MSEAERTVGAVECAMELLLCFQENSVLKLHALHEQTGLNKSRILRTAGTLVKYGFLKFDPDTKTYALGSVFLSLAGTMAPALERAKRAAQPILDALTGELGQTTMLSNAVGEERVVVVRAEPQLGLRYGVAVGQRRSLYHGATGTVLMAHSGSDRDYAARWPRVAALAEETYAGPDVLTQALAACRETGTAISQRGNAFALAVPVRLESEVAALTVVGATADLTDEKAEFYTARAQAAAAAIRGAVIASRDHPHT